MKTLAWGVLGIVVFWSGVSLLAIVLSQLGPIGQHELLLIMVAVGAAEFFAFRRLRRPAPVPADGDSLARLSRSSYYCPSDSNSPLIKVVAAC